ncbi:MAG TPA: MarR family transcriptional regulator [Candidatus Limnocylindrales bacterium]|nr:MarR family transcriptional regulator [Candidatus Limnocylindrales bacterium]
MEQPYSELSLLWHVFAMGQRVKVLLGTAMAGSPLTPDEYAVYSVLFDDGPTPPTGLARRIGMPPTTMSHYVRAMLERGHAERLRSVQDGRSFSLALTDAGVAIHRQAAAHFNEANDRFRDALEIDEAFLVRALGEIGRAADDAAVQLSGERARVAG